MTTPRAVCSSLHDAGYGTAASLGVVGVCVALLSGLVAVGSAAADTHRARSAADMAALAASQVLLTAASTGSEAVQPCTMARRVAVKHGATLVRCTWQRWEAWVEVELPRRRWLPRAARALSRAGPPDDAPSSL